MIYTFRMDEIDNNIEAFKEIEADLKKDSINKWALMHASQLVGVYETFDEVVKKATTDFEPNSYVIRQIGTDTLTLPVSVAVLR